MLSDEAIDLGACEARDIQFNVHRRLRIAAMRDNVGPIVGGKAMQIRAGPERGGRWLLRCDDIKPGESRRARSWVALCN